jgi:hypothetical protein
MVLNEVFDSKRVNSSVWREAHESVVLCCSCVVVVVVVVVVVSLVSWCRWWRRAPEPAHPLARAQYLAVQHYKREDGIHFPEAETLSLQLPLSGDIFIEFKSRVLGKKPKTMCYFWFNTAFIEGDELVLPRGEVDRAHLDKKGKKFHQHFQIELRCVCALPPGWLAGWLAGPITRPTG